MAEDIGFGDDSVFGSKGSFFNFYPREGSFECNPPFIDRIVGRMLTHIEALLSRAEASGLPLSFTIIVKKDRDAKNWQRIRSSRYKTFDMTLWQGEHGYSCERMICLCSLIAFCFVFVNITTRSLDLQRNGIDFLSIDDAIL